jgi:hypothetical protein
MPAAGGTQKRALIVGCNYRGTSHALKGCINDAKCLAYCLQTRFGFRPEDCVLMTDDSPDPRLWPTRENLLTGMQRLVAGTSAGDRLFFSFSGHGSQTQDWSGDEADGFNETLIPAGWGAGGGNSLAALFGGGGNKTSGMIVDDEINAVLINPLPEGVNLHAVIDGESRKKEENFTPRGLAPHFFHTFFLSLSHTPTPSPHPFSPSSHPHSLPQRLRPGPGVPDRNDAARRVLVGRVPAPAPV